MRGLVDKIKNGERPKFGTVERLYKGLWIKYPIDRIYYLMGYVKIRDFETDETIIFKMPEREELKKGERIDPKRVF